MEKHIGQIKWFGDKVKNTNIGFIHHTLLGDLFFHETNIEPGQDLNAFKEDEAVVFVSQVSKKYADKLEAVQVKLLTNENDLKFLFNQFLSVLYNDKTEKLVYSRIKYLIEKTEDNKIVDELLVVYQLYSSNNSLSSEPSRQDISRKFLNVCKNFFPDKYQEISNHIFVNVIDEFEHIETEIKFKTINDFLRLAKEFSNIVDYSEILKKTIKAVELRVSIGTAHNLWLNKYIDTYQIDYISQQILSQVKSTQRAILNRCPEEDKLSIFFKIIDNLEKIKTDSKLEQIKSILNLSKEFASEQYVQVLNKTLRICSPYQKLSLWLEDYHQELYFDEYKIFTTTLNPDNQKKFVKKTLKYIHEGKVKISVEEFTSINVISYESSKSIENTDNIKLDYSTSIMLNTISELNNQHPIETRKQQNEAKFRMFDLIINQIKEPTEILEIVGYFDECGGRCYTKINEIKNEDGQVIDRDVEYIRNTHKKPKTHPICDGRKFLDDKGIPVLDDNKLEYWWCANQRCYKPSREIHSSDEWEKYTLLDFLIILKVNFIEKDFEMYLNIINTANRFLKHLKCRECNHILRPVGKSNFALYGVNTFNCTNENCTEKEKSIYLTHCLNGKCGHDIDSRDSARCKPYGADAEKYGWYICNYCHACCSTDSIKARISNMESRRQEYNGHTEGH
ncbi:MAG: hypothetical protein PHD12_05320, partial [Methylotenera sp.]|nr:hypothetical protein [Methylotenera sp.]